MITDILIGDMTKEQLEKAYEMAFDDLLYSDENGIAHKNARRRCESIYQEAIRRGYIVETPTETIEKEIDKTMDDNLKKKKKPSKEEKKKMKPTKEEKLKIKDQERIENNLKADLQRLREGYYNEPTYFFKVGDRVQIGNIPKSIVTEIIDDGKFYKLRQTCKGERGAKDYERDSYSDWTNMRPHIENVDPKEDSFSYESEHYRQITYTNQDLSSLLGKYYGSYAGIDTEPDYQRGLVWELEDKISLIDSIFKKIDIGKFTFIKRAYKDNEKGSEILDGKQRLNAIVEFYEDRFKFRGRTYSELNWYDKIQFKRTQVFIGETTPMTNKEKYEYFLRLNTGGKPQDKAHIDHVQNLLNKCS